VAIDRVSVRFAFSEAVGAVMALSLRRSPVCAPPELLARFEIPQRKDATAGILARSGGPEIA
jgi:hypothetical protein